MMSPLTYVMGFVRSFQPGVRPVSELTCSVACCVLLGISMCGTRIADGRDDHPMGKTKAKGVCLVIVLCSLHVTAPGYVACPTFGVCGYP